MATIYLRSTDGSDSDDGSTWALAKATLAAAVTAAGAGGTVYVSQVHAETQASNMTISSPGTFGSPVIVVCGNDGAQPPTSSATTATVTTTGNSAIIINGGLYVYGVTFSVGTGNASTANLFLCNSAPDMQMYQSCAFRLGSTNNSPRINVGGGTLSNFSTLRLVNTTLRVGATGQRVSLRQAILLAQGGGWESGGTAPTTSAFTGITSSRGMRWTGGDFDALGSCPIFDASQSAPPYAVLRDCKMGSSWALTTGSWSYDGRYEAYNCDSGDTNYKLWIEDAFGTVTQETTIVLTGGASDGTTPISHKMVTNANAGPFPFCALNGPELLVWNSATGSSKTVTVEIVNDGTTLTDADIWANVMALNTSGYPLAGLTTDAKSSVLASAANQTSSSATWTTTGLSSPVKQKLEVTFTPQEVGFFVVRVVLCKASKTVYVDPKPTVS